MNNHSPVTPEPPVQRNGCLTGLLILAGLAMLLPGACVLVVLGSPGNINPFGFVITFMAMGGVALIFYALRRN